MFFSLNCLDTSFDILVNGKWRYILYFPYNVTVKNILLDTRFVIENNKVNEQRSL